MADYFNVKIEFDHQILLNLIRQTIEDGTKGYICVIDANVLTMAQNNTSYRKVLCDALVNTCDGSSIALMASHIYKKKFEALNGPKIFNTFIESNYKHLLLGSTIQTLDRIRIKVASKGFQFNHIYTLPLPFNSIDYFDYESIAEQINKVNPDIIWVSLGAPKQEVFMSKILPYINRGVMFGIGAAFNFYIGDLNISTFSFGGLRFIWLGRLFHEPKKLIKRLIPYILIMPRLYLEESRKKKSMLNLN